MFKLRDGFKVWTSPGGMVLVGLESGRLDACLRYVADSAATGVVVSRHHGFEEPHLDCLLTCRSMQGLYVVDAWPDLSPIKHLDHLEWLQVGGSSSAQPFRLASFPKLKVLRANWWPHLVFEGGGAVPRRRVSQRLPSSLPGLHDAHAATESSEAGVVR
jgi:hypothetical protein